MSPVAETNRITDLYLTLGEDHSLLAEFERDPRALLEESGLDEQAVEFVLAGDLASVQYAVSTELARDPLRRHLATMWKFGIQIKKKKAPPPKPHEQPPVGTPANPGEPPKTTEPGQGQHP